MASLNHLNQFPVIANVLLNFNSFQLIVLVVGLAQFLLLHIFNERKMISNFFLGFQAAIKSQLLRTEDGSRNEAAMKNNRDFEQSIKKETKKSDLSLSSGDMEIVLKSLGMLEETAKVPASLDSADIFNSFDETNLSLDEVKEAFDVFDKNKDGFIDSMELQTVLCALGLREGSNLENCRRMIVAVDDDGDGRVDFSEFVKFMEASMC